MPTWWMLLSRRKTVTPPAKPDELSGLPDDLDAWVLCPKCADDGGDLLASKYPMTNAQFERFVNDEGYVNPKWWGGKDSPGWRWRMTNHPKSRGKEPVTRPRYWQTSRFGKDRHGYPVVGVSWYEAILYATWLAERLKFKVSGCRCCGTGRFPP